MSHHGSISQSLHVCIKIMFMMFIFGMYRSKELNSLASACLSQAPAIVSGPAILQLKIQKWNPGTNAKMLLWRSEKPALLPPLIEQYS